MDFGANAGIVDIEKTDELARTGGATHMLHPSATYLYTNRKLVLIREWIKKSS